MRESKQAAEIISSAQNPRVKQWAELQSRKGRDKTGRFLIEGLHLVEEALGSELMPPDTIVYAEDRKASCASLLAKARAAGIECVAVSESVLAKCTDTLTPQPVFAVVPKLPWRLSDLLQTKSGATGKALVIAIDGMQDPGNLGTIIRSADAVGATGIVLGKGTVDLYNPKTVRSTMGSLFHLPIVSADLTACLPQAAEAGVQIVGTSLQGAVPLYDCDLRPATWIVIGNEGQGVSEAVGQLVEQHVIIPMQGRAESLNAAMAATVMLFEAARQRSGQP
ncbi:RNA methyltransferase, TrmH family [Paenibacillus sp. UNCCL117]|uniref:TrmH family RNA methyltransferase n=1 Tax=unclassified Paenibacillus TaxID=185978 RepID=UPI000884A988|nr:MULTISPECIES: RNA methyltransferase [unclassified Paenibacillus]SDE15569.1 RNA methyltransferase, TrmH family [Paenibacillus sp. cl123]SFW60933.1 RNA methyltransferase, TrmH family [Paenibacillus sp. UNCCL117]